MVPDAADPGECTLAAASLPAPAGHSHHKYTALSSAGTGQHTALAGAELAVVTHSSLQLVAQIAQVARTVVGLAPPTRLGRYCIGLQPYCRYSVRAEPGAQIAWLLVAKLLAGRSLITTIISTCRIVLTVDVSRSLPIIFLAYSAKPGA